MKRKICCINTKYRDSSLQHFPKQSRQHLIIQAELLIEKDKRTNHYNYLLFSPLFLFDPDRAVLPTSFLMPIIKERQGAISAISDLKLAKKENISLRNLAFYYTKKAMTGLTNTYNSLEDALFCNARLRTYEISKMMPIISEANQHQNKTNQKQILLF
jgi:hypothetical protein